MSKYELIGLGKTDSCCSRKEKLTLLLAVSMLQGIVGAFFLPGSLGRFIGSNVKEIILPFVDSCFSLLELANGDVLIVRSCYEGFGILLFQVLGSLFYAYYIFVRLCIPQFRNSSQETFNLRGLVLCIFNSILPGKAQIRE